MKEEKQCKCGGKCYYIKVTVNGGYPNLGYVYENQCKKCYQAEWEAAHKEAMRESARLNRQSLEESLYRAKSLLERNGYAVTTPNVRSKESLESH